MLSEVRLKKFKISLLNCLKLSLLGQFLVVGQGQEVRAGATNVQITK